MRNQNVSTIRGIANADDVSLDEICDWARKMADRGVLPGNAVRLRVSALRSLTSVLGADEEMDPVSVLHAIEQIGQRWAVKNDANPDTVRTYVGRARTLLSQFFDYRRDPQSFQPKRTAGKDRKSTAKQPKKASPAQRSETEIGLRRRGFRLPLGEGRDFEYDLPSDGINVSEAKRIAYHLLTMARDFDPESMPSDRQIEG